MGDRQRIKGYGLGAMGFVMQMLADLLKGCVRCTLLDLAIG